MLSKGWSRTAGVSFPWLRASRAARRLLRRGGARPGSGLLAPRRGEDRYRILRAAVLGDVARHRGSPGRSTTPDDIAAYRRFSRQGELEAEIDTLRARTGELDDQIRGLTEAVGRVNTALELLDSFDELWEALVPEERLELLHLLIERIDIDEPAGKLQIAFHDLGAPFPAVEDDEEDEEGAPDGDDEAAEEGEA